MDVDYLSHRNGGVWSAHYCDHKDDSIVHCVSATQGRRDEFQHRQVHTLLLSVLLLLSGEVHEIPKQECIHTDSNFRIKLLYKRQGSIFLDFEVRIN
jgi:hypothetical protein